jgi:hypothetical protein
MNKLAAQFQLDPQSFEKNVPTHFQEALGQTLETQQVIMPYVVETEMREEIQIITNKPTVEVCNYMDVMIDPTAKGDIDKANFVIYRFQTSLANLKKDGIYNNLDHITMDSQSILSMPDDTQTAEREASFTFQDEPRKQFYAYEYWGFWDIQGNGVLEPIVATWAGDTIIRMELNPFPDKKVPFITVPYLPIKESVFGEPDGVLIEDNQKIIGALTRGMIDVMGRSANGQKGIRKDALDPVNKRRYDRGEDYEFNPQVDPRQAMIDHVYPEIPQSALLMLNLQNQEAESLTGVKAFAGGLSGEALGKNISATSVRGVLDAASKRELGILRRLADGIVKVGCKFISMNAEFLSEEEVIRITNDEFVTVNRDDLDGKIDIRLDITTAEEDNQKASEIAFMLQTMGQTLPFDMTKMLLSDAAKLRKMPTLAKRIDEFQPQPDPLQQQLAQLQIAKLQAEIQKLQSEAAENYAEAELDQAKADDARSARDLKNLDFIEQESGTKHLRDVDKITSQAGAQARKSIIESQLPKPGSAE